MKSLTGLNFDTFTYERLRIKFLLGLFVQLHIDSRHACFLRELFNLLAGGRADEKGDFFELGFGFGSPVGLHGDRDAITVGKQRQSSADFIVAEGAIVIDALLTRSQLATADNHPKEQSDGSSDRGIAKNATINPAKA